MDPITKRHLWNYVNKIRESGKCIVLTSHSMEECEALCTRLAIMVNGRLKCLGSIQRLKDKFSSEYILTIKLKSDSKEGDYSNLDNFLLKTFSKCTLKERYQQLSTYQIQKKALAWSKIFGIMENAKKKLNIEDYSLNQSSLEQVCI